MSENCIKTYSQTLDRHLIPTVDLVWYVAIPYPSKGALGIRKLYNAWCHETADMFSDSNRAVTL